MAGSGIEAARLYTSVGVALEDFDAGMARVQATQRAIATAPEVRAKVGLDTSAADEAALGLRDRMELAAFDIRDKFALTAHSINDSIGNAGDAIRLKLDNVAQGFENNRTAIQRFATAGSQLSIVASVIGGDFADAGGEIGKAVKAIGDTGLVISTVTSLAPGAIAAVSGIGNAAGVSAVQMQSLAAAEAAVAAGAPGAATGIAGTGLGLAGIVAPFAAMVAMKDNVTGFFQDLNHQLLGNNQFLDREDALLHKLNPDLKATAAATGALAAGQDAQSQQAAHNKEMNDAIIAVFEAQSTAMRKATGEGAAFTGALGNIANAGDREEQSLIRQNIAAAGAANTVANLEDALKSAYGITISDAEAALYLARGMDAAAIAAQKAAAGIAAFKAGHPTNPNLAAGTADAQVQFNPGTVNTSAPSVGDQAALDAYNAAYGPDFGYNAPEKPKKGRAGPSGPSAAELARQQHQLVVDAYEADKAVGDKYYDDLHATKMAEIEDSHTQAEKRINEDHNWAEKALENAHRVADQQIEEAHKAADEAIQAQRKVVDDQLQNALRADAAPVTAAEKQQQQIEDARRLRDLNEQLTAARASGDARKLRDAEEALQSFQARQNIAQMKDAQAAADDAARSKADQDKAALDAKQKAEDATYEKHKADEQAQYELNQTIEDVKYRGRQDLEEARYEAHKKAEDQRYELQKKIFDDHIDALENSKNATVRLAQVQELKYFQDAVALAKSTGGNVALAQHDLEVFIAKMKASSNASNNLFAGGTGSGGGGSSATSGSGNASGGGLFEITINVDAHGGIVEPGVAEAIARQLEPALIRVFRIDQIKTAYDAALSHTHNLAS